MSIGLTPEQTERLDAAIKVHNDEIMAISNELCKDCKTVDDVEMARLIMGMAIEQSFKRIK